MVTSPVDLRPLGDRIIDVLWVNNLRSVKRPDRVLSLARQLPQYQFVMVGGSSRGAERLFADIEAEASGIPNLEFLGSRPFAKVNELLSKAKVLLNTSELEGFPNTYLQAWMRGVPIVATFDPDQIIRTEKLGLSVDSEDQLAGMLVKILDDDEYRREAASRSREFAVRRFSPSEVVKHYTTLINA